MSESTLSMVRVELQQSVALLLGFGLDSTTWDAGQRAQIDHSLTVGLRRAYAPVVLPGEPHSHDWSFLKPLLTGFEIHAAMTGTATVAAGVSGSVVTQVTGDDFPSSWAAAGELVINGVSYSVASRDSATQLTLDDTSLTVASATDYTLQQVNVPLPDLFEAFDDKLYFEGTANSWNGPIERVHINYILAQREHSLTVSRPRVYAVFPENSTGDTFQHQYLAIWPTPDSEYLLTGVMRQAPYKLTSTLIHALGGYKFAELLRESCLAAAESEIMGEANGPHYQLFMQRLAATVSVDRRDSNPGNLGLCANPGVMWPCRGSYRSYSPWVSRDLVRWYDNRSVLYSP